MTEVSAQPTGPSKPPRKKRRRLRWIVGACGLIIAVACGWTYYRATRPEQLRQFAEQYLESIFATPVEVSAIDFDPLEGVTVSRVTIADPDSADPDSADELDVPALSLSNVSLGYKPAWLLLGRIRVSRIEIDRVEATAVYDDGRGGFNLQRLLRTDMKADGQAVHSRPDVHVNDLSVALWSIENNRRSHVDRFVLDIDARYSSRDRSYRIDWVIDAGPKSFGACTLTLDDLALTDLGGGSPWLRTETARLLVKAIQPSAEKWLDLANPTGALRVRDFALNFGAAANESSTLSIQFDDVSLSIPAHPDEYDDPSLHRFLTFDNVDGGMDVDGGSASVELTGMMGASPCHLVIALEGPTDGWTSIADIGFDVRGSVDGLQLPRDDARFPDEERLIHSWRRFANFYRDFNPAGVVDLDVHLTKPMGSGGKVELQSLALQSIRTDATCRFFPYRVYDLTGRVEVKPDGVQLLGLAGRHGDGAITVDGWMSEPFKQCAARLHITGTGIQLDDEVCSAMSDKYRSVWAYAHPSGLADIDTTMVRPQGADGVARPWHTVIQADLTGAGMVLEGFPYPISKLFGRVLVLGDTISAQQLQGRAGEGLVELDGYAQLNKAALERLQVEIQAASLQIDDALINALPTAPREQLLAFSPSGQAGVEGVVTYSNGAGIGYDIVALFDQAKARWEHLPLPLTHLTGDVHIVEGLVQLDGVSARCGDAQVRVDGDVRADGDRLIPNLTGDIQDLRLDDNIREVIPPQWRTMAADWNVDGPFDVSGALATDPGGEKQLTLAASIAGTSISHSKVHSPLSVDRGIVTIQTAIGSVQRTPAGESADLQTPKRDASKLRVGVNGLAGRIFDAPIGADGSLVIRDDRYDIEARGSAKRLVLSVPVADLLPWRLRRAYNNLRPTGMVDLDVDRFTYRADADTSPDVTIDGDVRLYDIAFDAGLGITGANGVLRVSGHSQDADGVSLSGGVSLDHVVVGGQPLDNAEALLVRDAATGGWRIDEIVATLYGGLLRGQLETIAARPGETRFDASFSVTEMSLDQFAHKRGDGSGDDGSGDDAQSLAGVVNGRMYLSGISGDPASRRGGGRIAIENAEMYRLPIPLAVLEVLSLQAPKKSAFQRAESEFFVTGDTVRLESILLHGQSMAMIGEGAVYWPTRDLDLRMVTVSPHRWAKVPLLTELLEGASRELMQVRVTGTPDHPIATGEPLRGITDAMRTLLNPNAARAIPASSR